ncbi:MAG TPA: hypothetical protein DEF34_08320 [Desulfotomaculum sp.]|nr:MAG: hypothetical protein VR67_05430 [Peptococcaceae bacterium BRH_c8a]KJS71329.1 MAG: hypothetical protein JL56_15160 [Desulfotomaculum sp. BICA1-6]HBX23617.1 hypothetical protein [Desulfotomaculum sp.]
MRLAGLYVDGWGILHDFTLGKNDLGRGLNIVFGPNEAGKSTLLSFIRAILFGFKAGGAGYEPLQGGRRGGHLLLEDGQELYRVERYGRGKGKVTVELPGGDKTGEDYLRTRLLRGIGPVLFNNVFALGMDELRRLDELQRDEISAYIYGAGTGASPRRLAAAVAELDKTADNLFRPRGRTPEINELLHELDSLDRKIKGLEQQPKWYFELREKLAALEQQRDTLKQELTAGRRQAQHLGILNKARGLWVELLECRAVLREHNDVNVNTNANVTVDLGQKIEILEQAARDLDRLESASPLLDERRQQLEQLKGRLHRLEQALSQAGSGRVSPWPALAAVLVLGIPGAALMFRDTVPGLLLAGAGLFLAVLLWTVPSARAGEKRRREKELRAELAPLTEERTAVEAQLNRLARERVALETGLRQAALTLTGQESLAREDITALRRQLLGQRDTRRRLEELHRQLTGMAGSPAELTQMERELAAGKGSAGELEKIQAVLADLEEQLNRLVEQAAGVKNEMEALETGEELALALQQREMLRAKLSSAARQWHTAVLARTLLDLAREKHEQERQPAVLAQASEYIGPMTGGRYTRVVAPVGAAQMLEVEEPGGRRVPARALSRGAAAQLYLAVRLALARHLGTVLTPMPIILDDVTVDFDASRLLGALQVLARVAQEQQVLLFTCHQHILTGAREQAPGAAQIKLL